MFVQGHARKPSSGSSGSGTGSSGSNGGFAVPAPILKRKVPDSATDPNPKAGVKFRDLGGGSSDSSGSRSSSSSHNRSSSASSSSDDRDREHGRPARNAGGKLCHTCGSDSHLVRDCPFAKKSAAGNTKSADCSRASLC